MQQVASRFRPDQPPPTMGRGKTPTQKIILIALALVAISGLIMGFVVGLLTRPPHVTAPTNPHHDITTIVGQTATATPIPTIDVTSVGMGCPNISAFVLNETANSTTSYTFTAQVMDKSIESISACGKGKPLFASNITCKLWLTKDEASLKNLSVANLKPTTNLQSVFPGELSGGLIFAGGASKQVQPCSTTGATNWTYQLAPTIKSGTYFLAVVSDWQGTRYNWTWRAIFIKGQKGSNNSNN